MRHAGAVPDDLAIDIERGTDSHDGVDVTRRILGWTALLAIAATVLALVFVQRMATTYRDGLAVARQGADVGVLGAQSAADLTDTVAGLVDNTATTLGQAGDLLTLAAASTSDVGDAMTTNLPTALDGSADIADELADVIEAIEWAIPGDHNSLRRGPPRSRRWAGAGAG